MPASPKNGTPPRSSEDLVNRFFAALEAGDIDTLRGIYAPDAVIWHNDDLIEQPVEDNLKVLRGLHRAMSGLRYDIIRRAPTPDGVLQQHILRGHLPGGTEAEIHAAMYLQVRDGHITRIEEYLDSANRTVIKEALGARLLPGSAPRPLFIHNGSRVPPPAVPHRSPTHPRREPRRAALRPFTPPGRPRSGPCARGSDRRAVDGCARSFARPSRAGAS
jgi:ketosteroid isomerase-like protein